MAAVLELFTPTRTESGGSYTGWSYEKKVLYHSDTIGSLQGKTIAFDTKCTVIDNQAGSLTFTIKPDNPCYNSIFVRRSEVLLTINENPLWCGYVSKIQDNFYRQKTVTCTGCVLYLQDSILPTNLYRLPYNQSDRNMRSLLYGPQSGTAGQADYTGAGWIRQHSTQMGDCLWKRFTVPDISQVNDYCIRGVSDFSLVSLYSSDYVTPWTMLTKQIIEGSTVHIKPIYSVTPYGYVSKALVIYANDTAVMSHNPATKTIRFGKNLVDYAKTLTSDKVYSDIFPVGAEVEGDFDEIKNRVTIESVNSGLQYIENDDSVTSYGRIFTAKKYSDFKNISQAQSFRDSGLYELLSSRESIESLEVTAVDLYNLTNDSGVTKVCDTLRIYSEVHGIDTTLICTKAEYNIDNPKSSKLYFGKQKKKVSVYLKVA